MKRRNSSLYALAVATGAGLLFAVPAMAGTAYTTYTNDFTSTTNGGMVIDNPADADYNYTAVAGIAFNLPSGRDVSAGGYTDAISATVYPQVPSSTQPKISNHVEGAAATDHAPSAVWQVQSAGPSTIGYTGDNPTHQLVGISSLYTKNPYPTVDLGGTVSFDIWVDSFDSNIAPTTDGTLQVELEINGSNSTVSASDVSALGKSATAGTDTSDLFMVGATPSNGSDNGGTTTPNGTPTGGKTVKLGVAGWQTITFNLASDPHTAVNGATSYGTGLGDLYGIYFTTNGDAGQVYSANLGNLVITAAPEPSAWLGLAAGGAMLLGLGLVSARRRRGANAA